MPTNLIFENVFVLKRLLDRFLKKCFDILEVLGFNT